MTNLNFTRPVFSSAPVFSLFPHRHLSKGFLVGLWAVPLYKVPSAISLCSQTSYNIYMQDIWGQPPF